VPCRQVARSVAGVDGNHACARRGAEDLHSHVPEATDTDHHRGRRGAQLVLRSPHRVVRRQPGIGQGSGLDRVETLGDGHQVSGGGDKQVLRHAPVEAQTAPAAWHWRQARPFAVGLQALETVSAGAASPCPYDCNRLPGVQAPDARAHRVDPPCVLVSERERRTPGQHPWVEVVHEVQVRMACASGTDLHHHLARTGLGDRNLLEHRAAPPGLQAQCLHVAPPAMCAFPTPTLRGGGLRGQRHSAGDHGPLVPVSLSTAVRDAQAWLLS
jgi:hypothetical protein